jgi:hypothetical protein
MATIRYHHFARPSFLKRIRADVLRQFLNPWRNYLESRGLDFTSVIDCDHLGLTLATPDADTPTDLIEALEICDAVCSTECLEELVAIDQLRDERLLQGQHSLTDAVLITWAVASEEIERIFNRAALELDRSLHVYRASTPIRSNAFGNARLSRLRQALSPMFENHLRGSACRITAHERPDGGHALVIRHGDPINKAEAINEESGETEPIVFRPESIDLAFFDPSRNEWRISGRGKWLQDLYSEKIAKTLHEDACVLSRSACYTLRPLLDHGLAALDVQTDIVRNVRLAELQMSVCGATMRLSGRELHHAFEALEDPLNEFGEPQSARLSYTLSNRRSALNVTIHEGKATVRGDIDHPAIEDWLVTAGFLIHETDQNNQTNETEPVPGY